MPNSPEQAPAWLAAILSAQSQQLQLLEQLMLRTMDQKPVIATVQAPVPTVYDPYGDLVRDLPVFNYEKDDESTFDAWFQRYEPVINDRGSTLSERKRNLLVDKLDNAAYKTYAEHVLPLKPADTDYDPESRAASRPETDTHSPPIRVPTVDVPAADVLQRAVPRIWQHNKEEVRRCIYR
ncbi:unnamed protein product [Heligmosomoides polygyrus]|uniref:DUF7083 domain-containing protein n=1 Tax=Heligmosomoides polygyrus TaxID=6339 RepID=A0A183FA71_HELPZ|nr:unnamed protein product [Heligmosomoides polygyrus]